MRSLISAFAVGLGVFAATAKADLAPPVPPPAEVKIKIELDENAKVPQLIIPLNTTQPRRGPRPVPGKKDTVPPTAPPPGGAKPEADQDIALDDLLVELPTEATPTTQRHHVLIAGLALALSLSFGGLWILRRSGRGSTRALVLFVAAGATLAGSTVAWANAPPPRDPRPPVALLPTLLDGKVNLQITLAQGDTIRLVLDKESYEKLKEKPKGK
jgi:hypothetical protein